MLKVYGIEHICYLLITTIPLVLLMILLKLKIKTDKEKRIMFMILGIIDIISVTINRIAHVVSNGNFIYIIPDSFCGMSGLILGIGLVFFKKDNILLHAIWLIGLTGMIATYAYPDFLEKSSSIFDFLTLTSLWHHTVTLFNLIAIFLFKYIRLTYKKAWIQIPGVIIFIALGYFLIYVCGVKSAFYLNTPAVKGTNLFFYVMYPIYLFVYALVLFLAYLYERKHNVKMENIKES